MLETTNLPSKSRAALNAGMRICLQVEQGAYDYQERCELLGKARAKRDLLYKHARQYDVGSLEDAAINAAASELHAACVSADAVGRESYVAHLQRESAAITAAIRERDAHLPR